MIRTKRLALPWPATFGMIVSHQLKTIFIHVHRTGGTAFTNVLRQYARTISDGCAQHSNAATLDEAFFNQHQGYQILGFTRNPWERIFSWYSLLYMHNPKSLEEEKARFENFVASDLTEGSSTSFFHYNSLDYFSTPAGELMADKIIRYEHFEKEVIKWFIQFNLKVSHIPVVNQAKGYAFRKYYTETSRDLLAEKCKRDIEYFNYRF